MNQFTPLSNLEKYPELNRRITDEEYETLVDYAIDIGIENGFNPGGGHSGREFYPGIWLWGRVTLKMRTIFSGGKNFQKNKEIIFT